jgi:hypothetical protein
MITRIGRLTLAELLKLRAHPFFACSLALILLGTLSGCFFLREDEKVWRAHNAIATFAGGAKVGLKLSTFVALVFGSMLFAGEFDRGTIKLLLTRPVTRTDLFAAKSVVAALLALFLVAAVLYVSLAVGCLQGELGPVWDGESYLSNTSYETLLGHAAHAVAMSVSAIVAAAFFGLLVSNATESSGFAVAIGLTLFIVVDEIVPRVFRDDEVRRLFFNTYPGYAFDILRDFARGSSTGWKQVFDNGRPYVWVPLASIAAFVAGGYAIFRRRNITA